MNIKEIAEKLKTDKAFAEKYAGLKGIDAILSQAKTDGYDVTKEDVEAVIREMGIKSGELTETELAAVAGGNDKDNCPQCGSSDKEVTQVKNGHTSYRCKQCGRCWG